MISSSFEKPQQKVIYLTNFAINEHFFFEIYIYIYMYIYLYFKRVLTYSKGINNI